MSTIKQRTLGQAIDAIIGALTDLSEQQQKTALLAALSQLGIEPGEFTSWLQGSVRSPGESQRKSDSASDANQQSLGGRNDIRALREKKGVRTAKDMACLVAYYLREVAPESERKDTVTTDDVEKYFKQAGYKLPTRLTQLLIDTKQSGFFDSVSRGEYRLNTVGYNRIVHDLPEGKND